MEELLDLNPHSDLAFMIQECAALVLPSKPWRLANGKPVCSIWQPIAYYHMTTLAEHPRMPIWLRSANSSLRYIELRTEGEFSYATWRSSWKDFV